MEDFERLKKRILGRQPNMRATVELRPRPEVRRGAIGAADAVAVSLGFKPIGEAWQAVDRTRFVEQLAHCLHLSLAYSIKGLGKSTAVMLATDVAANFPADKIAFLLNSLHTKTDAGAIRFGMDVSTSTMDAAFVVVAPDQVMFIVFEDED